MAYEYIKMDTKTYVAFTQSNNQLTIFVAFHIFFPGFTIAVRCVAAATVVLFLHVLLVHQNKVRLPIRIFVFPGLVFLASERWSNVKAVFCIL